LPVKFEEIYPAVKEMLESQKTLPKSFKVKTIRSFKNFSKNSLEVSRSIGGMILGDFPNLKVQMKDAELVVQINITSDNIFVSVNKYFGMGGQPYGTTGHLITLLSGGFDSPVASYLMAKRGCSQTFTFFYSYPFVSEDVKEKILDLASFLGRFQRETQLYIIPFGEIQKKIAKNCREEYRTLLFRKYMVECAGLLAEKLNAEALCTGDSLAQVSSQTMGNISLIDSTSKLSIFRPLLGFNKSETISLANDIGTYKISERPHDDACSLFAPKHPIIKPDKKYWEDYDKGFNYINELNECLSNAEVFNISICGEVENIKG
jgi:thiamine biosynthesis protein ThiI